MGSVLQYAALFLFLEQMLVKRCALRNQMRLRNVHSFDKLHPHTKGHTRDDLFQSRGDQSHVNP